MSLGTMPWEVSGDLPPAMELFSGATSPGLAMPLTLFQVLICAGPGTRGDQAGLVSASLPNPPVLNSLSPFPPSPKLSHSAHCALPHHNSLL